MNPKIIQSFSLAKLLETYGHRPDDLLLDGCIIASRVRVKDNVSNDLFRYPTRLNAFAVVFCSQGTITLTSNITPHTIGEKTLFVNLPGTIIQAEPSPDSVVFALICEEEFFRRINIDFKLVARLFLNVEKHPCIPLDREEWEGVGRSFDEIRAEGSIPRSDRYSPEIMRSMIRTLAYKICRIIEHRIQTDTTLRSSPRSRNEEYFNEFMSVLTKYYTRHRSVGFYAEQLHLTPKYLTTLIRKISGRTAIQWIDDYVMVEAKNLLKYSTMSIQEIAYYLNFPNQSSFGKYFRNHTDMTPSAYRQTQ